jgi:hypothetical protein
MRAEAVPCAQDGFQYAPKMTDFQGFLMQADAAHLLQYLEA